MKIRFDKLAALALSGAAALALSGCYVVPINPATGQPYPAANPPVAAAAPASATFAARLYPANELAAPYGTISGTITSDLHGRGTFSMVLGGESFSGEATRNPGSRAGTANGAGSRGNYIQCRYQMNSTAVGSGDCRLNNGAQFSMHIGG